MSKDKRKEVDGWEIPIHQSLLTKPLVLGIKREFAIILWTLTTLVVLHLWWFHFIAISGAIHAVVAYLTKHDRQFIDCLLLSFNYKQFYE